MLKFVLEIAVEAPPTFVTDWWLDYGEQDAKLTHDMVHRTVERLDERRTHLVTDLRFGKRPVRVDGVVTRESEHHWSIDGEMTVNGRPFAREQIAFSVIPMGSGSTLHAGFRFRGKGVWSSLALTLVGRSIRKGREEAYLTYAREMAGEFRKRAPTATRAGAAPPSARGDGALDLPSA